MPKKPKGPLPGTDATTGAEVGVGSGLGAGADTTAGRIDDKTNGAATGPTIIGSGLSNGLQEPIGGGKAGPLKGEKTTPESTIDLQAGVGIPPRAGSDSLLRDAGNTIDAERVNNTVKTMGPDIGGTPRRLRHEPKLDEEGIPEETDSH